MSEEKTAAFRELCKLTGQAVSRYRMIGEGDRILVGLSGGKDSFMLLHALHALRRKAPVRMPSTSTSWTAILCRQSPSATAWWAPWAA